MTLTLEPILRSVGVDPADVMREHCYASWRTAPASVMGIYLIADTSDGRQYIGKADG